MAILNLKYFIQCALFFLLFFYLYFDRITYIISEDIQILAKSLILAIFQLYLQNPKPAIQFIYS